MTTHSRIRCYAALLALGASISVCPSALAQVATPLTLDSLRMPSSPAFVLLGVEPTSIQRPSTPRALAVGALSANQNPDLIPRDYALEVAPYWLRAHPDLSFDEYVRPTIRQGLLQTLSVSVATSELLDAGGGPAGTGIGLGVRTRIVAGHPSSAIADRDSELRRRLRAIQDSILDAETEQEEDALVEHARVVALEIQRELRRPVGFLLEAAGGATTLFSEDRFDEGRLGRIGVWVTPSYRLEQPYLDILGLGRYLRDDPNDTSLWDLGSRLALEVGEFVLSAELIRRFRSQGDDTERFAAIVEYRLRADLYLTGSFGKNYDRPEDGDREPLIALLGINFGFGGSPTIQLPN